VQSSVLLVRERLQIAQAVIKFVPVDVMQHKTRQKNPVFLLVFVAVQRHATVAKVPPPIAEKRSPVIS
jgi:hypothetical protein